MPGFFSINPAIGRPETLQSKPAATNDNPTRNTTNTNFNWGAGMAALQTINANYSTLTTLSSGDDKNKLINQAAVDAGKSGVIKEVGGTPMTLQEALQTVANDPALQSFLETRDGGIVNNRYGQAELNDSISQLNIMEGSYNAAQLNIGAGSDIQYASAQTSANSDNGNFALTTYVEQLIQRLGGNGGLTTDQLKAGGNEQLAVLDKTGTGGNGDGIVSQDELQAALWKLDANHDGTIDTTEQQVLTQLNNANNNHWIT